jgi:hypothetical protein
MFNCFRADLYRLLHGKALYITLITFLLLIAIQVLAGASGSIGVSIGGGTTSNLAGDKLFPALTPGKAFFLATLQFQTLILFGLVLIYLVAAADFTSGSAQNTIAAGLSRSRYYLSKLVTSFVLIELFYLAALLLGVLIGIIAGGASIASASIASTSATGSGGLLEFTVPASLYAIGVQSLMALTIASVGTAMVMITRKGTALITSYLIFFIGMMIVLFGLQQQTHFEFLQFDFITGAQTAASIAFQPFLRVARLLCVIAVYLAGSLALGMAIFHRAEIK